MQLHQLGLALDALPSPLTILDYSGVIVYVNKAWKQFSDSNGLAIASYGLGCNYLDYCDNTILVQDLESIGVAQGIRNVISG
jgi:two-component system, NarL family, sensor kinase